MGNPHKNTVLGCSERCSAVLSRSRGNDLQCKYVAPVSTRFAGESLKALRVFIASQPPGYRDALNAAKDQPFDAAFRETIRTYIGLHALERQLDTREMSMEPFISIPTLNRLVPLCPVYLIPDENLVGLPPSSVKLISRIAIDTLVETAHFQKKLQKQEASMRVRWSKIKKAMDQGRVRSVGFEKFADNIFSIRLNDNFRVHLRLLDSDVWEAFDVGSHKAMGHG